MTLTPYDAWKTGAITQRGTGEAECDCCGHAWEQSGTFELGGFWPDSDDEECPNCGGDPTHPEAVAFRLEMGDEE